MKIQVRIKGLFVLNENINTLLREGFFVIFEDSVVSDLMSLRRRYDDYIAFLFDCWRFQLIVTRLPYALRS